ncbi:MAG TPA: hypothetical protein VHR65_05265 [Solirubrobacterales bacterium]|jgi:hypothetical protein|nr:hypothetical protein [Solirubrobacterales bacterium]
MTSRVADIDGWLLGFGGWLGGGPPTSEEARLAVAVLEAEVEMREREFEAIEHLLTYIDGGHLTYPDDAAERALLFEAASTLGWHVPPQGAEGGPA